MQRRLVLVGILVCLLSPAGAEDAVQFSDPQLKRAVEDALQIFDPTPSDMLALSALHGVNRGITSLDGLEHAANLQTLSLRLNRVTDVSAISSLTKLTWLDLSKNNIRDLTPLANLINLEELNLHANWFSDIDPLGDLTNLRWLVLRLNSITNISGLSNLSNLETLAINSNRVKDIAPLSNLTTLRSLSLHFNNIEDVSPLGRLTELESLDLEYNEIKDISPLTGLLKLDTLTLCDNPLNQAAYRLDLTTVIRHNPGLYLLYDPNPNPPASISASDGVFADRIQVTWDEVYNGPAYTTYYQVVRSAVDPSTSMPISAWQRSRSYEDLTALHGVQYDYSIQTATDEHGSNMSVLSDPDSGSLFATPLPPLHVDDNAPLDLGASDGTVSDPNENGTPEHPFDRIQEAIDAATHGMTILVHSGVYAENIDFLGKQITLEGIGFPVIEGSGPGPLVRFETREDPNCLMMGFVLTRGTGSLASAIYCNGSSPSLLNCLVVGNQAADLNSDGSAIYCIDSNAVFVNFTISDNLGGNQGGAITAVNSNITVTNSILWNNVPAQIVTVGSGSTTVTYSTIMEGGREGLEELTGQDVSGNISTDPLFAQPGDWVESGTGELLWVRGDYHLLSQAGRWNLESGTWKQDLVTSPSIDAGNRAWFVGDEPSPNGKIINMGAFGGTMEASKSLF